jgi:enoyl-CoA hydratase
MSEAAFENILTERKGRVGIVTLNRPKALNALCDALVRELGLALDAFEADDGIGAIVVTGSEKAFAAGADIKEMASLSFTDAYLGDYASGMDRIAAVRKPVVAAVAGYCLGGGAELALLSDVIIAADTAKFAQPEITLGIIPGMGATQRLPRAVGKAKAMDMILTGRMIDAAEAERIGLVSRVVAVAELGRTAQSVAETIAAMPLPAVLAAKESVQRAFAAPLAEGIRFERRVFQALFATGDQKEGMAAFLEKRPPRFTHR